MKIIIGIAIGFALGFLVHSAFFGKKGTSQHWEAIDEYNAHINNPANWKREGATGLSSVSVPNDITENLAALVNAGELTHLDLVFPRIPKTRESQAAWMTYCQTNKQVIYATGNPSYPSVKTSGDEPLHLNVWFRPADEAVIQRLVKELEEKHGK